MQNIIFWAFASIAVISALLVIIAKNPVRAVLSLIATFLATSGTWLTMDAEFLGITLVLVYVGAVMVLFMFVVMMLDINYATVAAKYTRMAALGALLATALFVNVASVFKQEAAIATLKAQLGARPTTVQLAYAQGVSNASLLGETVFTKYLLQFEIAGVLLLVAIVAAIALIYRGPHDRKGQSIAQQVKVDPATRVRLVDGT